MDAHHLEDLMKKTVFAGLLALFLVVSLVSAYYTPPSSMDMLNRYAIYNVTNITSVNGTATFKYFIGDGQGITNLNASGLDLSNSSVNYSKYTNISNIQVNTTTLKTTGGVLDIVYSFFTGLFYTKTEVDTINASLQSEISTRISADTNLSNNISSVNASLNSEISTRGSQDTALANNISSVNSSLNTEITNRNNSDNSLNSTIQTHTSQISGIQSNISSVNSSLNTEISNRQTADSNLQTNISALMNANVSANGRIDSLNTTKLTDVTSANSYIGVSGTINKTLTFSETVLNTTINNALATSYFNVTNITVITGTGSGNLSTINIYDNIPYNISEVNADINFQLNFTGITSFNQIIIRYQTISGEPHSLKLYLWVCNSSSWESYKTLTDTDGVYDYLPFSVADPSDHICNGNVQIKFNTTNIGVSSDKWQFDWVTLSKGVASQVGIELDPLSIHRDGMIPLSNNWDAGGYNITNVGILYSSILNVPWALNDSLNSVNTTVALHTSQISSVNSTAVAKVSPGNCPSGQVVQNTTTSGVQCIATAGAGTVTQVNSGNYTQGGPITGAGTIDVNITAIMNAIGNATAVNASLVTQTGRIDSLNSTQVTQASQISGIQTNITSVNTTVGTHTSQISGIQTNITTQTGRIDSINSTKANTANPTFTGTLVAANANFTGIVWINNINSTNSTGFSVASIFYENGVSINTKYNDSVRIDSLNSSIVSVNNSAIKNNTSFNATSIYVQGNMTIGLETYWWSGNNTGQGIFQSSGLYTGYCNLYNTTTGNYSRFELVNGNKTYWGC